MPTPNAASDQEHVDPLDALEEKWRTEPADLAEWSMRAATWRWDQLAMILIVSALCLIIDLFVLGVVAAAIVEAWLELRRRSSVGIPSVGPTHAFECVVDESAGLAEGGADRV